MDKDTTNKKTDHSYIPALLARKFIKDYEASIAEFPENNKLEFVDHLLESLDIFQAYLLNPIPENWKIYTDKENAFLKKHGQSLKIYRQKKMYLYYGDRALLVEKEIYTPEEWNTLNSEQQKISEKDFIAFIDLCRNTIYNERDFLLLEQPSSDEKEAKQQELAGASEMVRKGKVKREATDKLTCLSQEQTVLLMYYMQKERVFLKDEYLTDLDAGKAFEILTGYSHHTLRQNLSKFHLFQNKTNLKEIDNLLTRLKIAIDKALKEQ